MWSHIHEADFQTCCTLCVCIYMVYTYIPYIYLSRERERGNICPMLAMWLIASPGALKQSGVYPHFTSIRSWVFGGGIIKKKKKALPEMLYQKCLVYEDKISNDSEKRNKNNSE